MNTFLLIALIACMLPAAFTNGYQAYYMTRGLFRRPAPSPVLGDVAGVNVTGAKIGAQSAGLIGEGVDQWIDIAVKAWEKFQAAIKKNPPPVEASFNYVDDIALQLFAAQITKYGSPFRSNEPMDVMESEASRLCAHAFKLAEIFMEQSEAQLQMNLAGAVQALAPDAVSAACGCTDGGTLDPDPDCKVCKGTGAMPPALGPDKAAAQ